MGSYIRFWWLSLRKAGEPFHKAIASIGWTLMLLTLAGLVGLGFLPELFGSWRNWLDGRDHILADVYLAYPWILPLGMFLAWTIGWGTYRSYRAEELKTEKQSIPHLEVEVTDVKGLGTTQRLNQWEVMLTFRPNMRMQIGAIDWLWDVLEDGNQAARPVTYGARSIPTGYLEGVESHKVEFVTCASVGTQGTHFRVLAHGQYWYSGLVYPLG